jgi:hypothetical protein
MAAANLLTLLDDIAVLLDDVAMMSKVAAKKTAGLIGDDLAVNAEQVTGFASERELPVIWAVAKGATLNKVILIPAALLLSAFASWLLIPLLMLGGTYLCYEAAHKIQHKLFHKKEEESRREELKKAFRDKDVNMKEFEKKRINGAIRTDFILSAEILVIALSAVTAATLAVQLGVLIVVSIGVVVGVYGLVAGIVKIDDLGLKLQDNGGFQESIGDALVQGSPVFMKGLGIVGTVAMLLVGGGIYAHYIKPLKHLVHDVAHATGPLEAVTPYALEGVVGLVVGAVAVVVMKGVFAITGQDAEGH